MKGLKRCDQCGALTLQYDNKWLTIDETQDGDGDRPWRKVYDLCSWACLGDYGQGKKGRTPA